MRDLNSTMFYKAKFNITANKPEDCDLLWELVMVVRKWIVGKLNRHGCTVVDNDTKRWTTFKLGGKLYDVEDRNRFFAESAYHVCKKEPEKISWACMIVEKPAAKQGCAPREWITEIGFQTLNADSAEISYVVTYSDAAGFIGPCQEVPQISVPNVIRNLFSDKKLTCTIGNNVLTDKPQRLRAGDYPRFEKLLLDPERKLPLLYISPKRGTETKEAQLLVTPKKIAETVVGNALVFYSDDLDFSKEMRYLGNAAYNCTGGSIRVYMPHIDFQDKGDQYRHRFISAREIEKNSEDYICHIFRRALAQDVHYYESMFRLENCKALQMEDIHRARMEVIRQKSENDVEEATKLLMEESAEREKAELAVLSYQDQLEEKKREIYSLNIQLESMRNTADECKKLESALQGVRTINSLPRTPAELAKYFAKVYPERIAFTERGYRSLKECTTKPEVLWEVLYYMANDLYDLLQKDSATAYKEFKEQTGWDCSRGEGSMTRKDTKLMRQYVDEYEGQEIDIEAHVKGGVKESDPRFVRIYFGYDPTIAKQILIGHCGKHLENFSTRKLK